MAGFRIPIQVNVFCFTLKDHEILYLLLKRSDYRNPCWQGVTGAPFPQEALVDAAKREVFEETGLTIKKIEQTDYSFSYPIPGWHRWRFEPETKIIEEYVFSAKLDNISDNIRLSDEHCDFKWIDFQTAISLLSWETNKEALRRVDTIARSNI
jgi:dihydroneopterin triphosphate diphosphatase